MQLETVSKVKGWCALAGIALPFVLFLFAPLQLTPVWLARIAMVSPLVSIFVGVSWVRQRNWMRRQSYAARQILGR